MMFQTLRIRLLFSYLGVMMAILGVSTVAVYHFVAYNLYQQLDERLLTLASAASHNFDKIKSDPKAIQKKLPRNFDNDGDLDIPWQDLRESNQSIEWFDANKNLLGKAGNKFIQTPPKENFHSFQVGKIRTVTISVHPPGRNKDKQQIEGYIRVSESTEKLEAELNRLFWGLSMGGVIALTLTGFGGLWLTRQSLQPIEKSFQRLKEFTADASHELRSPLTVIKTSVEVMQNYPGSLAKSDTKKLVAIASATNQMTRLIEDLLLLARNDTTSTNSRQQWLSIPLDELLEDLVDLLRPQAEVKEITLRVDVLEEVFVKGDALELKRLFSNLLENALQYTPTNATVTVSMLQHERFVIVNIQDTGIGIAPEHIPLVFERFWRADKARSRRNGGSGLGLAIAQAIARHHGGIITLSSQVGVGSCFSVRLPIDAC